MKVLFFLIDVACRLLFAIQFVGARNVPLSGPVVLAANHPSYLDPVLIQLGVRSRIVRWLGMREISGWPVFGRLARAFGMLEVGESPRAGGHALWRAIQVLEEGGVVGVFPEGGRTVGRFMGPAKPGLGRLATLPGVAVVPTVVFGSGRAWPRGFLLPAPHKIVVAYLPPLRFEPGADPREVADAVRERIVELQGRHQRGPAPEGARLREAPDL